jgi:hypothetical protein
MERYFAIRPGRLKSARQLNPRFRNRIARTAAGQLSSEGKTCGCCGVGPIRLFKKVNPAYSCLAHLSSGVSHFRPDDVPRRPAVVFVDPAALAGPA